MNGLKFCLNCIRNWILHFDFDNSETFDNALVGIDRIFILRPPHISDIDRYFRPLISAIKEKSIKEVVFLSVQGAEKSKVIPHNKIEKIILENNLDYIFIRPSYFMQNLTMTFIKDIKQKRKVVLPAGKVIFNWVDIKNIGEVAAILLDKFDTYKNLAYELTGLENESFATVVSLINETIHDPIRYRNVNPFRFFRLKRKEKMEKGMILVMILLHFLPRFQKEPEISGFYKQLTRKEPTSLRTFIQREKALFEKSPEA